MWFKKTMKLIKIDPSFVMYKKTPCTSCKYIKYSKGIKTCRYMEELKISVIINDDMLYSGYCNTYKKLKYYKLI